MKYYTIKQAAEKVGRTANSIHQFFRLRGLDPFIEVPLCAQVGDKHFDTGNTIKVISEEDLAFLENNIIQYKTEK